MNTDHVVAVVIGRNEGRRLEVCLKSLVAQTRRIIYVDSGSTDQSVAFARSLGCEVVRLDVAQSFTAARARNAGVALLRERFADAEIVQFVDGDCEVVPGWLERASAALTDAPELAVVCGRRRERHPERTPFNRLCDREWDTPVGLAKSCGGDSAMRLEAFAQVGGFDGSLIAGEEPELCFRLRKGGWRVRRLDAEMTLHDADMTRLSQWYKRALRAGHAYAEHAVLHGRDPERPGVRKTASHLAWGLGLPSATLLGTALISRHSLWIGPALAAAHGLRIYRSERASGRRHEDALLYSASCVAAKVPAAIGALKLLWSRATGARSRLIEYK